jgi:hypothetical protein
VRAPARLIGALAALAAAAFCAVLAIDVNTVSEQYREDDVRYQKNPGDAVWDPSTILASVAEKALGVDDDKEFRNAVRFFRLSGLRNQSRSIDQGTFQQAAELQLSRVGRNDSSRARRSAAANLRGVINLVEAATADEPGQLLQRSLSEFRDAIRLDPRNDDAKYNLELVLQIAAETGSDPDQGGGSRGDAPASGAGAASTGSGY